MKRYRTALVDDAADLRRLLGRALESSGRFEVVGQAGDGRAGVDVVVDQQPDLVLLDLSMPVMDGLEALPLIREAAPDATVVILSGHSADMAADRALAGGAMAYLEKGLRPTDMVDALLEALDHGHEPHVARPSVEPPEPYAVIGQLAHDLRTPLATALGFLELSSRTLPEGSPEALYNERAWRSVERLNRLVTSTLTYARDGHRSLEVQDDLALADVIDHGLRALLGDHPDSTERVRVCIPAGATVRADEIALERILQNLMKNALVYGTGDIDLVVTVLDTGPVALEVTDEGPGLSPHDLDAVFEPFQRGSAGREAEGSGLGLALSARLVQQMGGRMSATNRDDGVSGAVFRVELPAGTATETIAQTVVVTDEEPRAGLFPA